MLYSVTQDHVTSYVRVGGIGEWSTSGCSLMGQSGSMVMCSCNHLTSFAVVQVSTTCCMFRSIVALAVVQVNGGTSCCSDQ